MLYGVQRQIYSQIIAKLCNWAIMMMMLFSLFYQLVTIFWYLFINQLKLIHIYNSNCSQAEASLYAMFVLIFYNNKYNMYIIGGDSIISLKLCTQRMGEVRMKLSNSVFGLKINAFRVCWNISAVYFHTKCKQISTWNQSTILSYVMI